MIMKNHKQNRQETVLLKINFTAQHVYLVCSFITTQEAVKLGHFFFSTLPLRQMMTIMFYWNDLILPNPFM